MTTVTLYALGSKLEVTGSDDQWADRLRHLWSRCLDERPYQVEAEPLVAEPLIEDRAELQFTALTQNITTQFIGSQVGRLLMFHAGAACALDTGKSVIFVAPGGTGKTTLSKALCSRLGYVTDETVGITRDGLILPYQKPLSVRQGDGTKHENAPDDLGLLLTHPTPRVHRIILLTRDNESYIEELSLFDAIAALTPETSSLHKLHQPLQWLSQLYDTAGPIVRYHYREATDITDGLVGELMC